MKKNFQLFYLTFFQLFFLISICSTSFAKQNSACVQQIPSSILTQIGSLRLATSSDLYQEPIQKTQDPTDLSCTAFEIDLNKDMKKDYAFFAVDASEKNYFLKIFIAKGDTWKETFTRKFPKIPEISKGLIYTYGYFKDNKLNVCDLPFLEAKKTSLDSPARLNDLADLCYCTTSYAFNQGKIKSSSFCD